MSFNLLDFPGIDPTGNYDSTVGIQAAITAAGSRELIWPKGDYLFGDVSFPSGIKWRSDGALLKRSSAASSQAWFAALGTHQQGNIEGLIFDYGGNSSGQHILNLGENARNWKIDAIFRNMKTRAAIRADWATTDGNDGYIDIRGQFENGDGAGAMAFYAYAAGLGIRAINFEGDLIDVGGSSLMIAMVDGSGDATTGRFGAFQDCSIKVGSYRGNGTGTYGAIPIELWGHDGLTVTGARIHNATRGIGMSWVRNCEASSNWMFDQSLYAYEIGNFENLSIIGGGSKNCKQYVYDTASQGYIASHGLKVIGATIEGTGLTADSANTYFIQTASSSGLRRRGGCIEGVTFNSPSHINGCVRLADFDNWRLSDCQAIMTTEFDGIQMVNVDDANNYEIIDCEALITADYTSNNPGAASRPFVITTPASSSRLTSGIRRTKITYQGATPAANGIGAIGLYSGDQDFGQMVVEQNQIAGLFTSTISIPDNGGQVTIRNNDIL